MPAEGWKPVQHIPVCCELPTHHFTLNQHFLKVMQSLQTDSREQSQKFSLAGQCRQSAIALDVGRIFVKIACKAARA